MLITVQEVSGPVTPAGKKYQQVEVAYVNDKGKASKKKLFSFGDNKGVFEKFADGAFGPGDSIQVNVVKNGEYWDWTSVEASSSDTSTTSAPKSTGKPNWNERDWETEGERYKKNLTICRQNALTASINFLGGSTKNEKAVLDTAQVFYDWTTQDFRKEADVAKALTPAPTEFK